MSSMRREAQDSISQLQSNAANLQACARIIFCHKKNAAKSTADADFYQGPYPQCPTAWYGKVK